MNSLTGSTIPICPKDFTTHFQSFLGKVVNDKCVNMAASIGLAVITSLSSNYVTGLLAGSVVYLLAENYRISEHAEQLNGKNIELGITNHTVSTRLDLCTNKEIVPKYQEQIHSLKMEIEQVKLLHQTDTAHKDQNLQKLELELGNLKEKLQTTTATLQSTEETKGKLELELQQKQLRFENALISFNTGNEANMAHIEQMKNEMNQSKNGFQQTISKLEIEIDEKKSSVQQLQEKISSSELKLFEAGTVLEQAKAERTTYELELEAKLSIVEKRFKNALATLAKGNEVQETTILSLKDEINILTKKLQRSEESLVSNTLEQDAEVNELISEIKKLEKRLEFNGQNFDKCLEGKNSFILAQQNKINSLEQGWIQLNTTFESTCSMLADSKNSIITMEKQYRGTFLTIKEYKDEIARLKSQLQQTQSLTQLDVETSAQTKA